MDRVTITSEGAKPHKLSEEVGLPSGRASFVRGAIIAAPLSILIWALLIWVL